MIIALEGRPFGEGRRACPGRAHALALAQGVRDRSLTCTRPATRCCCRTPGITRPAAALAAAGFTAIGTTSLGVAAAIGVRDGASETKEATYEPRRSGSSTSRCPISVDAEHGFSEDPYEVAEYAQRLEALGVAGINLEDRNGDPDHHARQ